MTTLKQIFIEVFADWTFEDVKKGDSIYTRFLKVNKKWLQQKQLESEYPCWAKTIIGELLKELNQIPENCPIKYRQSNEIPIKCPCYYKDNCEVFNNAENIE